jgi:hypothetical protein
MAPSYLGHALEIEPLVRPSSGDAKMILTLIRKMDMLHP